MSLFGRRRILRRLFAALEKVAGNVGLIREASKEMRTFTHEEGTLMRQLGESRQRMVDLQLMRAEQTRQMHTTVARQVLDAIQLVERRQHALLARQAALVHMCRQLMQERDDALAAAAAGLGDSGNGGGGGGGRSGGSGSRMSGDSGSDSKMRSGGDSGGSGWGAGEGLAPGCGGAAGEQQQGSAWPRTAEREQQQQGSRWEPGAQQAAQQAAQQVQSLRPADVAALERLRDGGESGSGSSSG